MRNATMLGMGLILLLPSVGPAATRVRSESHARVEIRDGRSIESQQRDRFAFQMQVLGDDGSVKAESTRGGKTFLTAVPEERYSIRLYNPLPVRVAVNLTVDGLNSITGKPSGISDGKKWVIDPWSSVTIPGWQVTGSEARRFYFTETRTSYAAWREETTGQALTANCGVIGAAFFWNHAELDRYYAEHPIYAYSPAPVACKAARAMNMQASSGANARAQSLDAEKDEKQAGTGMGERESHPTEEIAFSYDTGMYRPSEALLVYYEFARPSTPNPFPGLSYAPEMPTGWRR